MSFDDYFNEAPEADVNEADISSDDFWDDGDDYQWHSMDALHHGELNDAQLGQPDSMQEDSIHSEIIDHHDE